MSGRKSFPALLLALLIIAPELSWLAVSAGQDVQAGQEQPAVRSKIGRLLAKELAAENSPLKAVAVWIFFRDKEAADAPSLNTALTRVEQEMAPRCLWRRAKVRTGGPLVDPLDLPVSARYMERTAPFVQRVRTSSRWLNAVSAEVRPAVIASLARLPFVRHLDLVRAFRRDEPRPSAGAAANLPPPDEVAAFYGPSFTQINQIDVWPLHRLGYSGRGVMVGMLDTGFRTRHEVFSQAHLVAQHDFVNGDEDVSQDFSNPADYSDAHGTGTWSVLGGYKPGELVGPAYGADFVLAKTETENFEEPIEEDYWVAGIEWAEGLGAEVVSSSLGYIDWYTFADMDGETAVTTRAANRATSLGVVVVNAAGNERDTGWGHIIAPADGFEVIACGAVDSLGQISSFSSPGPTYDGRIKPEVCALGVGDRVAVSGADGSGGYSLSSGTSFSTPLVAGAATLLLEIHPDWTPAQVRQALLSTASRSQNPDNDYGWGILDAALAADIGWTPLVLDGYSVDDDSSGRSLGDGDGRAEAGETVEISVRLKNRGRSVASGLRARLSLPSPEIIITTSEITYPAIPMGGTAGGESSFAFTIPVGFLSRPLSFWLRVEGSRGLMLSDYVTVFVSR